MRIATFSQDLAQVSSLRLLHVMCGSSLHLLRTMCGSSLRACAGVPPGLQALALALHVHC